MTGSRLYCVCVMAVLYGYRTLLYCKQYNTIYVTKITIQKQNRSQNIYLYFLTFLKFLDGSFLIMNRLLHLLPKYKKNKNKKTTFPKKRLTSLKTQEERKKILTSVIQNLCS